ncbi:unnamed protein product [Sphagnum balticum]
MLNKYAKTLGIPLLNIVRRKEQRDLLVSEGAEHVIVTEGDWIEEYKEVIKSQGFNVLFDALGGGPVVTSQSLYLLKASSSSRSMPLLSTPLIAASGFLIPLTVLGIVDLYNKYPHKRGIINTAAASSLGRRLNRYAKTLGIPLLNIVRRKEQRDLLVSEGAEHVIVTEGDWIDEYKEAIKSHGFNLLFDALGGGPVSEALITNIGNNSYVYIYGRLAGEPLALPSRRVLSKGIFVTGYSVVSWYSSQPPEKHLEIKSQHSDLLKTDFATQSYKVLKYSEIAEALELSVSKATEGKIILVPD